jgi:hypothetical protein
MDSRQINIFCEIFKIYNVVFFLCSFHTIFHWNRTKQLNKRADSLAQPRGPPVVRKPPFNKHWYRMCFSLRNMDEQSNTIAAAVTDVRPDRMRDVWIQIGLLPNYSCQLSATFRYPCTYCPLNVSKQYYIGLLFYIMILDIYRLWHLQKSIARLPSEGK